MEYFVCIEYAIAIQEGRLIVKKKDCYASGTIVQHHRWECLLGTTLALAAMDPLLCFDRSSFANMLAANITRHITCAGCVMVSLDVYTGSVTSLGACEHRQNLVPLLSVTNIARHLPL
jgi:hypothetical protein